MSNNEEKNVEEKHKDLYCGVFSFRLIRKGNSLKVAGLISMIISFKPSRLMF